MGTLTVGHDSEGTLLHNGVITSALGNLIPFETEDGRGFPDNMNFEIAINPVTTLKEWHSKTESLLQGVRDQGYDLLFKPTVKYPDESLKHPEAYISGCNADQSAYTQADNVAPDFLKMDATRSCGAHVHAGDYNMDPYNFAKWMDAYVGLPLLLKEEQNTRRSLYGGAGCLRVKPYGAEYRVLSNVWLDNKEFREFVWEGTHKAVEQCKKSDFNTTVENWQDVPRSIDTHDVGTAKATIDRLYIFGVQEC